MKRIVNIAKDFEEAEAWDAKQRAEMTPDECFRAARVLQDRFFGTETIDVRAWHRLTDQGFRLFD